MTRVCYWIAGVRIGGEGEGAGTVFLQAWD